VPQRVTGTKTIGENKKDARTTRIESTAESLAAPGVLGMDQAGTESKETIMTTPGGPMPELHVVQKGDTLWSLCSKYFNDPWRWPRLWAANPMITNPHWIFPGDVIRLGQGGIGAGGVGAPAETAEPPRPGLMSVNRVGSESGNAIMLRELGFIEAKDLEQAATITGSREEKIMLSSGDQAYLRYPDKAPMRAGERYSVFETDMDHPVVDSTNGKVYGYMVRVQGDLVVSQIAENQIARGTLVDTVVPIERGARVSAFVRQFKRVEPRPSNVNLEARVIATFEPNLLLRDPEPRQARRRPGGQPDLRDPSRGWLPRHARGLGEARSDHAQGGRRRNPGAGRARRRLRCMDCSQRQGAEGRRAHRDAQGALRRASIGPAASPTTETGCKSLGSRGVFH